MLADTLVSDLSIKRWLEYEVQKCGVDSKRIFAFLFVIWEKNMPISDFRKHPFWLVGCLQCWCQAGRRLWHPCSSAGWWMQHWKAWVRKWNNAVAVGTTNSYQFMYSKVGGKEGEEGLMMLLKKIYGVIRCFVQKNSKSGQWMVHWKTILTKPAKYFLNQFKNFRFGDLNRFLNYVCSLY